MLKSMGFSVLMSVYKNDNPYYLQQAIDSISINQTLKPQEIVLVIDGPITNELEAVIDSFVKRSPLLMNVVRLDSNQGLGKALQIGIEAASNELVMRMDSDDIALPERFERQIEFMSEHPRVVVCGGQIEEFFDDNNVIGKRIVPCHNNEIYEDMKSRCAFNHMTVALRRSAIMAVGNYQPWFFNEDYYLWIRLMLEKYEFANLPDILVKVRINLQTYQRRGGLKYFRSERRIQNLMLSNRLITPFRYFLNNVERFIVQVLLPNSMRGWIYRTFARLS